MLPDGRKMKLLLVMYIFEAQTDEKHRLSADKVAEKVNAMLNEKGIDDEVEVHATRKGIFMINKTVSEELVRSKPSEPDLSENRYKNISPPRKKASPLRD